MVRYVPLYSVATVNDDALPDSTAPDFAFEYVDISSVFNHKITGPLHHYNFKSAPSRARRLAQPGDIALSTVRTYLRAIAPVAEQDSDKVFSTGFAIIRPNPSALDPDFFRYATLSNDFINTIASHSKGVSYPAINAADIMRLQIPLPTLLCQRRIADYLDRETAEIDAAVADLDRYVELLKLRSKKLIASHLEGDYPRVKMGLLAEAIIGLTYRPENVVDHGGIHVYRSGNIQDSKIDRSNMLCVNVEVPQHLRFREEDILMCARNGSAKLVGKNAMVEPCDYGHTWGAFMTVIRSDLNQYLYWFFRSPLFDDYRGRFSTSTINQLTIGILNQIPVPLPTESERDEIVSVLNEEASKIEQLIAESSKLRNLLLRRRSVLITEVVTGRKQV